jgi:hypothetical protein
LSEIHSHLKEPPLLSGFDIPCYELFRVAADARIRKCLEPVEGISLPSDENAFSGNEALNASQVLPVAQIFSSSTLLSCSVAQ